MGFKSNVQQKLEAKNAKPVVFSFLTPVSDYVTKVYGDIKEDLTREDYVEIVREIRKENDLTIYVNDTLYLVSRTASVNTGTKYYTRSTDEEYIKLKKEEPITFSLNYMQNNRLEEENSYSYCPNVLATLDQLYYINDYGGYNEYLLTKIEEDTKKHIEDLKKEETDKIKNVKDLFADIKEFNIKGLDFETLEAERTVRKLNDPKTPAKEKLTILSELRDEEDGW